MILRGQISWQEIQDWVHCGMSIDLGLLTSSQLWKTQGKRKHAVVTFTNFPQSLRYCLWSTQEMAVLTSVWIRIQGTCSVFIHFCNRSVQRIVWGHMVKSLQQWQFIKEREDTPENGSGLMNWHMLYTQLKRKICDIHAQKCVSHVIPNPVNMKMKLGRLVLQSSH